MDRITNLKMDEMKKLVDEKEYKKALDVLKTIDTNKFKMMKDLSLFAFIYEKNKQYLEAKNILIELYYKSKTRRVINYLINIFIKMKYFEEAEMFYKEYISSAPNDIDGFILRYKLDKAENKPYDDLIKDLEELKAQEYMEEWSYELAKLYHKSGNKEKCVKECNDIVLWFGGGIVVEKAKLLKEYYLGNYETIDVLCAKKQEEKEIETNTNQGAGCDTDIQQDIEGNVDLSINQQVEDKADSNCSDLFTEETYENKETLKQVEEENYDNTNIRIEIEKLNGIFGNFLKLKGLQEQIIKVINNYSNSKKHLIITGVDRYGKTTLIKRLLTAFFKMGYIKTAKIAKIKSDKLNQLNLDEKHEKLLGGCLIVEDAGALSNVAIEQLIRLMDRFQEEIIVILDDRKEIIDQLLLDNPELLNLVYQSIDIPEYNMEELIGFVTESLLKDEYVLDKDAKAKLYDITNNHIMKKMPEDRLDCLFQVVNKGKELAEQRNILGLGKVVEKGDYEKLDLFKIKAEDLVFDS